MSLPPPPSSSPLPIWERERIRISEDLRVRSAVEISSAGGQPVGVIAYSWAFGFEVADSGLAFASIEQAVEFIRVRAEISAGESLAQRAMSEAEISAFVAEQEAKYCGE